MVKEKKLVKSLLIKGLDNWEEPKKVQGESMEQLVSMPLKAEDLSGMTQVGSLLTLDLRGWLADFLRVNLDIFTWLAFDMLGIPSNVVVY